MREESRVRERERERDLSRGDDQTCHEAMCIVIRQWPSIGRARQVRSGPKAPRHCFFRFAVELLFQERDRGGPYERPWSCNYQNRLQGAEDHLQRSRSRNDSLQQEELLLWDPSVQCVLFVVMASTCPLPQKKCGWRKRRKQQRDQEKTEKEKGEKKK